LLTAGPGHARCGALNSCPCLGFDKPVHPSNHIRTATQVREGVITLPLYKKPLDVSLQRVKRLGNGAGLQIAVAGRQDPEVSQPAEAQHNDDWIHT
jgi:hypothetical protein